EVDCGYRVRHNEGQHGWMEARGIPTRNAGGRAICLVGAGSDVTERKATERALRESEERYNLTMRAIKESVYEWDVAKDTIYYSPGISELVGLTSKPLQTVADWIGRVHPDDLPGYRA